MYCWLFLRIFGLLWENHRNFVVLFCIAVQWQFFFKSCYTPCLTSSNNTDLAYHHQINLTVIFSILEFLNLESVLIFLRWCIGSGAFYIIQQILVCHSWRGSNLNNEAKSKYSKVGVWRSLCCHKHIDTASDSYCRRRREVPHFKSNNLLS